jgi:hypothetical protein
MLRHGRGYVQDVRVVPLLFRLVQVDRSHFLSLDHSFLSLVNFTISNLTILNFRK